MKRSFKHIANNELEAVQRGCFKFAKSDLSIAFFE